MTPEGRVKADVKKVLQPYIDAGEMWVDWPVPGGYGKSSLDALGCHLGRFFAIETKRPPVKGKGAGKLTPLQERCVAAMRAAGGKVFIIDGTDQHPIEPLKKWLGDIIPRG